MSYDTLGDRMKRFERVSEHYLMRRTPVIIRIDGKAFHTLTASLTDRFDTRMHSCMTATMESLCSSIQGAILGYTQSDEISILVRDWDTIKTEAWFDYRQNKMESVAASIATVAFNRHVSTIPEFQLKSAMFDARAFNLPKEEVVNYFRWRIQDAERNSIQTHGRSVFSHKQLLGKSNPEVITMLDQVGNSWQLLDAWKKRGTFWVNNSAIQSYNELYCTCNANGIDEQIPLNTANKTYIEYAMEYVAEPA